MASSDDEDQHQVTLAGLQDQLLELRDIQRMHANRLEHTETSLLSEIDGVKQQIQSRSIYQAISSVDVHLRSSNDAQSAASQGFAINFLQDGDQADSDDGQGDQDDGQKQSSRREKRQPAERGGLEDILVDVDSYSSLLLERLSPEQMRVLVGNLTSTWETFEKGELLNRLYSDIAKHVNTTEGEPEEEASLGEESPLNEEESLLNGEESPKVNKLTSTAEKNRSYGERNDFEGGSEEEEIDSDEEAASEAYEDSDETNGESPPMSPRSQRLYDPPGQEEQTGGDPQVKSPSIDGSVFDTYLDSDNYPH